MKLIVHTKIHSKIHKKNPKFFSNISIWKNLFNNSISMIQSFRYENVQNHLIKSQFMTTNFETQKEQRNKKKYQPNASKTAVGDGMINFIIVRWSIFVGDLFRCINGVTCYTNKCFVRIGDRFNIVHFWYDIFIVCL